MLTTMCRRGGAGRAPANRVARVIHINRWARYTRRGPIGGLVSSRRTMTFWSGLDKRTDAIVSARSVLVRRPRANPIFSPSATVYISFRQTRATDEVRVRLVRRPIEAFISRFCRVLCFPRLQRRARLSSRNRVGGVGKRTDTRYSRRNRFDGRAPDVLFDVRFAGI